VVPTVYWGFSRAHKNIQGWATHVQAG
jgi:hypothetical protein